MEHFYLNLWRAIVTRVEVHHFSITISMCILRGRGSLSVLMTRVVALYPTFVLMQFQSGTEPYSSHGWKFRLSSHRKNEERKKQSAEPDPSPLRLVVSISLQLVIIPALIISLPLASYTNGYIQSSESLYIRLSSLPLPSSWDIASRTPLTLCKLRLYQTEQA